MLIDADCQHQSASYTYSIDTVQGLGVTVVASVSSMGKSGPSGRSGSSGTSGKNGRESDWENSCDLMKRNYMYNGMNAQCLKKWPEYILAHHRVESFCWS